MIGARHAAIRDEKHISGISQKTRREKNDLANLDVDGRIKVKPNLKYTGRFIMYSGITKDYYGKTVGHVFTKPVFKKVFFPVSCFSS